MFKVACLNFYGKTKGIIKIKRVGEYQDYEKGGLRMSDLETMITALRLAWIPRLLNKAHPNWKTVPNYHLKKWGGLDFLLLCNYRMKDFEFLPRFYHDILLFFDELKMLYGYKGISDLLLFNNRDILVDEKPFFFQEWFAARIKTIMDLLDTDGQFLSFPDLKAKFSLPETSFLHYYQVVSTIPNFLFKRAKELILSSIEIPLDEVTSFHLDESTTINLLTIKSKDFYWLLINKIHTGLHAGRKRWTKSVPSSSINWQKVFSTIGKCSKEKKTM